MSSQSTDRTTVLVVEDEADLADLYAEYLSDEYDVRTAYGGVEAIETLDGQVDVALIDRRMPVVSGNEVIAEIEKRGIDCRVGLVTAVDPDFDIIGMGCDDYVVKPVTREDILGIVDRLTTVAEYSDRVRELSAKRLKRNVLEIEKQRDELEASEEFQSLKADIATLEDEIDDIADEFDRDYLERQL